MSRIKIKWLSQPEEHDYPAALSYLTLIYDDKTATGLVAKLKKAPVSEFKAKDIFRASRLPLLGAGNSMSKKTWLKSSPGTASRRSCWSGIRPTARWLLPTATTGCAPFTPLMKTR